MIMMHHTSCCGVREINNLSRAESPEDALRGIARWLRPSDWNVLVPFITFTGVVGPIISKGHTRSDRTDDYGETFARFLERNNLGEVTRSQVRQNWTGNSLKVWIWHPDYTTLVPFLDGLEVTR